jgi:RNA polymerase sigma-70 factor (ECF subfamily)
MNKVDTRVAESDSELAQKGHAGDAKALEELLRRHQKELFGFIRRFVGGVADPSDVYQEVVLRIIENLKRYNPKMNFRTWMFTLAANYCKNVLRSRKSRGRFYAPATRKSGGEESIDVIESAESTAQGPEVAAEHSEFMAALENELQNLPPAQREVFILRQFNDVPFKEIASILKIPEATARSRMFLAMDYLRVRLKRFAAGAGEERRERRDHGGPARMDHDGAA